MYQCFDIPIPNPNPIYERLTSIACGEISCLVGNGALNVRKREHIPSHLVEVLLYFTTPS
ncbi:hypothetical protein K435DRAFT_782842 [Dendrothele bispora CBS 962.96]|uniref:Uncharacterized protein n=1 Tax=Dendrothele bispora (strain CBS 962.96) TaxID=1314807 RepID=A0A4S8LCS1_DENBC|nr:hypothetical protein K435DRAFT_782840 [Dendrothele bispora CBS 962.96]THU86508.1 hypothetical protein K435DRAFT_782842 [Dendrothele bispora CBS 962.96]